MHIEQLKKGEFVKMDSVKESLRQAGAIFNMSYTNIRDHMASGKYYMRDVQGRLCIVSSDEIERWVK